MREEKTALRSVATLGVAMLTLALVAWLAISAMGASASALPTVPGKWSEAQSQGGVPGQGSRNKSKVKSPKSKVNTVGHWTFDFRLDAASVPLDTDTPTNTPAVTNTPTITNTPTPIPTCGPGSEYVIGQVTGASIVPGVNDIGNHTDDGTTVISLPFTYNLYGLQFNNAIVGSNATLGFSTNQNPFDNTCLPNSVFNNAILPHWDDLRTDGAGNYGIFTSISGSDPNRIFNIEWRACLYSGGGCGGDVNFEIRLYQNQNRFDIIYGIVTNGGSGATVGVQRANGITWTQYECNSGGLTPGLQLVFLPTPCGGPTFTPSSTPQATATATPPAACGSNSDYTITLGTANITPGANLVSGSQCDDCMVNIPLPFTYTLYTGTFASVNASSNGNLQFTSNNSAYGNDCLPATSMNDLIAPHWDDLFMNTPNSGEGIYTTVLGSAPNRMFVIEWRAENIGGAPVNFEVLLYEGRARLDMIYGTVSQGGNSATVGVQRGIGPQRTQYECNTADSLSAGLLLTFAQPVCITNTPTPTITNTPIPQGTLTITPTPGAGVLVGHVTWQSIPQNNSRSILPITLTLKLGATEVNYPQQNTDASGFFTVNVGSLLPGVYDWRVQAPDGVNGGNIGAGFLANCGTVTLVGGGVPQTNMDNGLMKGGDANNDNVVNSNDFNILKADFGHAGVDRADFDNNLVVNSNDFNIMKGNFGQAGCSRILAPGDTLDFGFRISDFGFRISDWGAFQNPKPEIRN